MTATKLARTSLTRRLSADAWQHLLAGHLRDYARENGRWFIRLAGDDRPYTDDETGITDSDFRDVIAALPAHNQPVIVSGPNTNGRITRDERGHFQLSARTVRDYPELAGGAVRPAAEKVPTPEVSAPKTKVAAKVADVPAGLSDALAEYLGRLIHPPKRDYAERYVSALLADDNLPTCEEIWARKVIVSVERICRKSERQLVDA